MAAMKLDLAAGWLVNRVAHSWKTCLCSPASHSLLILSLSSVPFSYPRYLCYHPVHPTRELLIAPLSLYSNPLMCTRGLRLSASAGAPLATAAANSRCAISLPRSRCPILRILNLLRVTGEHPDDRVRSEHVTLISGIAVP